MSSHLQKVWKNLQDIEVLMLKCWYWKQRCFKMQKGKQTICREGSVSFTKLSIQNQNNRQAGMGDQYQSSSTLWNDTVANKSFSHSIIDPFFVFYASYCILDSARNRQWMWRQQWGLWGLDSTQTKKQSKLLVLNVQLHAKERHQNLQQVLYQYSPDHENA